MRCFTLWNFCGTVNVARMIVWCDLFGSYRILSSLTAMFYYQNLLNTYVPQSKCYYFVCWIKHFCFNDIVISSLFVQYVCCKISLRKFSHKRHILFYACSTQLYRSVCVSYICITFWTFILVVLLSGLSFLKFILYINYSKNMMLLIVFHIFFWWTISKMEDLLKLIPI
jgi:hypothetical protein